MSWPPRAAGAAKRRPRVAPILLLAILLAAGALGAPAPAAATTTASAEGTLLTLTNRARATLGLRPLRLDGPLVTIARDRAGNLAGSSTFSHEAAGGDIAPALAALNVQWYVWAEDIAWRPGGLTSTTAAGIFAAWRGSPPHWAKLMSRTLNYVGFGIVVRTRDGRVFASAVFTESRDHTAPGARIDAATRSGTTVTFAWHGYDAPLQTHWAGLRDFDVWYRVDDGAWRLVRDNTTATSLRLSSRAHGHRYWLMVRARDRAGNVGRTSTPAAVWVP